jgi:hypothetical protein
MAVKYHLYDEWNGKKRSRAFPVEELDALVTDAERQENPFAGWRQALLDAINEPPEAGMQYIIIRCGQTTCRGNGKRHLVMPEIYYLCRPALVPPRDETPRTRAYHYSSISIRRKKEISYDKFKIKGIDIPYSDDRTTTNWLDVTDYVAYHRNIDQITIIACTTRGCRDMKKHMHVDWHFHPTMRNEVEGDRNSDWVDDEEDDA